MPKMQTASRILDTGTIDAMWAEDMDIVELTFNMRGVPASILMSKDDVENLAKMLQDILLPPQKPE